MSKAIMSKRLLGLSQLTSLLGSNETEKLLTENVMKAQVGFAEMWQPVFLHPCQ